MCGRFTLTVHQMGDLLELLEAEADADEAASYRPRYNVAPGEAHWLLRRKDGARRMQLAHWGLINNWAKDPRVAFKQINARAETLTTRPAYREAFAKRRGVVVADGFYEWRGPKQAREPLRFHPRAGGLMLMAGLYDGWLDPDSGELRRTFTVITTAANAAVAPIHDRMPALLHLDQVDDWLAGRNAQALLRPAAAELLQLTPASPRLNRAGNDDPACLDPLDPLGRPQLSLF